MIRYYILPIETLTAQSGMPVRGPKYFQWHVPPHFGIDHPGIECGYTIMDYGLIDVCILVARDITQDQHDEVIANNDVAAAPENIDENIGEQAVAKVKQVMEVLCIPADWVDTSYTYRQILRMIAGLFQFAQRHHGMHNEQLIDNPGQLDLRWNQIALARRQRIMATADDLGYDYSAVQNTWLIRRILKHLGDQWGDSIFYFGVITL